MTTSPSGEPEWLGAAVPPMSSPTTNAGAATVAIPVAPGPGVTPPFAAPPREGRQRRLGIGIAIGAVVFVLCCGGGIAGIAALVVTTTNQRLHNARTVVTSYMNDWRKQDYQGAYQLLCDDEQRQMTVGEFADELGDNQVVEFTVDDPMLASNAVEVQVHVDFDDGSAAEPTFDVIEDTKGNSRICGTH